MTRPTFHYDSLPLIDVTAVCEPLPDWIVEEVLLKSPCHIDHEGYDLNLIEQTYYKHNGIHVSHDDTWYKDGGQSLGTNAIVYNWITQSGEIENLILDHSFIVVRYPILGKAREQILQYVPQRPELLRLLGVKLKCGLDLCIDYFTETSVEPIVHIEWDFTNLYDLQDAIIGVERLIYKNEWLDTIPTILQFNKMARKNKLDAFTQADVRSMIIFGDKSYKLIPTI